MRAALSPSLQLRGVQRRIMVYVWYPTDRKATLGMKVAPYLPDFDKVLPKLSPRRYQRNIPALDIQRN